MSVLYVKTGRRDLGKAQRVPSKNAKYAFATFRYESTEINKKVSVLCIRPFGQTVRAEGRRPFAGRVWAIAEAVCVQWEIRTVVQRYLQQQGNHHPQAVFQRAIAVQIENPEIDVVPRKRP